MSRLIGNFLTSQVADLIPRISPYKRRDECNGGTIFNIDKLDFIYLDRSGYEFVLGIDDKKKVNELIGLVHKKTKIPYITCCLSILQHLKVLNDNGFISIDNLPDYKIRTIPKDTFPKINAPNQVSWLITNECNLRCSHCGNTSRAKKENELSTEEGKELIADLAHNGVFVLDISGGEPLIRKDAIELFRYARSLGLEMGMTTNGTLVNEKIARELKEVGMYNIHVSLDGIGEVHDRFRNMERTFMKVYNTIRLFKKYEVPFGITTSISKLNFNDLENIKEFVITEKINSWEIYYAIPIGCMQQKIALDEKELLEFSKKIEQFKKELDGKCRIFLGDSLGYYGRYKIRDEHWNGCLAGLNHLAIDPEGNIKGCPIHPNELIEGNIRKDDLMEIWRSDKTFLYNRRPQKLEKHCKSCKHNKICRGGCKALMYCLTGDLKYNPMCLHHLESKNNRKGT